jgi:hypothetical protein
MDGIGGTVVTDVSGAMNTLSIAKQRSITLKGVKAGAKILKLAARSAAPKRQGSGALQQAQGVKASKGRKGLTISFAVQGARRKVVKMVKLAGRKKSIKVIPGLYDHLVEGGTKPHHLFKSKVVRLIHKALGSKMNMHPGAKANPYRLRAWNMVKDEAGAETLRVMGEELRKVLAKQKAKHGG